MSIHDDTAAFETWLRTQCNVVEADLAYKHERMKKSAFIFLRATFYRWAQQIEKICKDLKDAPEVLAVGDIHSENFGTWRDGEGRWVWGVNDFDEAAVTPYAFDLVRLAASIRLADTGIGNKEVAALLLEGYAKGLDRPRPTLLDEHETWMRPHVAISDAQRDKFWKEVEAYPGAAPPETVVHYLRASLPPDARLVRYASAVKGGGSLGRPRFVALAEWRGGHIVREAKALVPSAWNWAHQNVGAPIHFADLATGRYRAPDPKLTVNRRFIVRRVAADSRKLDLADLAGTGLDHGLLEAMGRDLGAIHAATDGAPAKIRKDLGKRPEGWLRDAAQQAADATLADFKKWKGK
jgi:hypothetical protein